MLLPRRLSVEILPMQSQAVAPERLEVTRNDGTSAEGGFGRWGCGSGRACLALLVRLFNLSHQESSVPHRKRNDTIRELHREAVRRQSELLLSAIDAATLGLRYFTPHGQALAELRKTIKETENILHDRPPDFQRWNTKPGPRLENELDHGDGRQGAE
jgi:hypothetical protein